MLDVSVDVPWPAYLPRDYVPGQKQRLEVYRRLGVVQMLLAYNTSNFAADGCHEQRNAGLSRFGQSLIAEMNRVAVAVVAVCRRSTLRSLGVPW